MTTITHRRIGKNGKIEVVPLGKDKLKGANERESIEILGRRSRITRAAIKRRAREK